MRRLVNLLTVSAYERAHEWTVLFSLLLCSCSIHGTTSNHCTSLLSHLMRWTCSENTTHIHIHTQVTRSSSSSSCSSSRRSLRIFSLYNSSYRYATQVLFVLPSSTLAHFRLAPHWLPLHLLPLLLFRPRQFILSLSLELSHLVIACS